MCTSLFLRLIVRFVHVGPKILFFLVFRDNQNLTSLLVYAGCCIIGWYDICIEILDVLLNTAWMMLVSITPRKIDRVQDVWCSNDAENV